VKIFVIGSSITSSYWNGAATYYRGIYSSLAKLGHEITFAEPDVYDRQKHRDGDAAAFSYVKSWVYQTPREVAAVLAEARHADLVIKHSGVGADDELFEREVPNLRSTRTEVAFWDVDAPATLARIGEDPDDQFHTLIPQFDHIFTYGGGDPVVSAYMRHGARNCHPIYNALDPESHYPVPIQERFRCDLAFVGNRLPDRERRVEQFFLRAAELATESSFLLGGEGWGNKQLPANVRWIGHVRTEDHNAVNCSARMVLNINRDSMASVGFSPPTRVFEAAGAGACLITDYWIGVEHFFAPDAEILVAKSAEDIVRFLRSVDASHANAIGDAMRARALREHTYAQRAAEVHQLLAASAADMKAA
jgi:spore maturation protein CgeB